jgi:hypothetical protein
MQKATSNAGTGRSTGSSLKDKTELRKVGDGVLYNMHNAGLLSAYRSDLSR